MADLADVETTIAALLGAAIYPNGAGQPSVAAGRNVQIIRGWPADSEKLDAALKAGNCVLSVFPMQGMTRNTTRYQPAWGAFVPVAITLTATFSGATVTIAGTATSGQVIGVASGGTGYAYRCGANDTPATIAAALAALIPFATASAGTITLTHGTFTVAQVVSDSASTAEVGRQWDGIQISAWCPDPLSRDALASAAMSALNTMQDTNGNFTKHMALPDGSDGIIKFARQYTFDQSQNANLYRRDLIFEVEYPTIDKQTFPAMLFGEVITLTQGGAISISGVAPPSGNIVIDENGNIVFDSNDALLSSDTGTPTVAGGLTDGFGNPVMNEPGFVFGQN